MRRIRGPVAATLILLTACTTHRTPPAAAPAPNPTVTSAVPIGDWPTYHGTDDRAGAASVPALAPPLRRAWSVPLHAPAYAQPIVVDGLVIAATENDDVYAVDLATGGIRWQRHLASATRGSQLPCGNIDPSGITGTPVYDPATDEVIVAMESGDAHHTLVALAAHSGATRWERDLDVLANRDRHAEQQRGALAISNGRVYVPFGGLYGDCGNYVGYLVAVPTNGSGTALTYAVPTARAAGMWAPPGPVVSGTGDIYVATGNGAEVGGHYDGSDSVLQLSDTLVRRALFAPSTWPADNAQDLDLGSTAPALVGNRIVIAGKRGTVYLLSEKLGGIGSQLATLTGCSAYGGAAVRDKVVLLPCDDGVAALQVADTSMQELWHNGDLSGSPVTANGGAGYAFAGNDLAEFDLTTGRIRARVHVGDVTRFTTPVPVGPYVVVATTSRLIAIRGGG